MDCVVAWLEDSVPADLLYFIRHCALLARIRCLADGVLLRSISSYRCCSCILQCVLALPVHEPGPEALRGQPRFALQYVTAEWEPAFLRQAREFTFFPLLPREASK